MRKHTLSLPELSSCIIRVNIIHLLYQKLPQLIKNYVTRNLKSEINKFTANIELFSLASCKFCCCAFCKLILIFCSSIPFASINLLPTRIKGENPQWKKALKLQHLMCKQRKGKQSGCRGYFLSARIFIRVIFSW